MVLLSFAWHFLLLIALPVLTSAASIVYSSGVSYNTDAGRKVCTVTANGGNTSDVTNILSAFSECGSGGNIVFPEDQNYWIDRKLNPVVNDVKIDWKGIWTVSSPAPTRIQQTRNAILIEAYSSPQTSPPGATTPTPSPFKTTGLPSFSQAIISP